MGKKPPAPCEKGHRFYEEYAKKFSNSRNNRDKVQLRRKLSLGPRANLPKCPHKATIKALRLDQDMQAEGILGVEERHHSKPKHSCAECACGHVAGSGTPHYGYGFCKQHERGKPLEIIEQTANAHLDAIRDHNPWLYRDGDAWADKLKQAGEDAQKQIDLTNEIDEVRSILSEIRNKCGPDIKASVDLKKIGEEIKDNPDLTSQDIEKKLDRIINYIEKKKRITELSAGKHVTMSDKTKYELALKAATAVSKLGVDHWTVNKHNVVTMEELEVWLGKFVVHTRRYISDDNSWGEYVAGLKEIGEPKRAK